MSNTKHNRDVAKYKLDAKTLRGITYIHYKFETYRILRSIKTRLALKTPCGSCGREADAPKLFFRCLFDNRDLCGSCFDQLREIHS